MKKTIFLILMMIVPAIYCQNLVENGNFEAGIVKGHFANGYPDGWNGWGGSGWHHSDAGYQKDGHGIAIWGNDTGIWQDISAVEGEQFTIKCEMIYHSDEVLVNKLALLAVEFRDNQDIAISSEAIGSLDSSMIADSWYSFTKKVTTPANGAKIRLVCITLSTGSGSSGKVFWDNIELYRGAIVNDPDYNGDKVIDNLDFAQLAEAWYTEASEFNLFGDEIIDLLDLNQFAVSWLEKIDELPDYELLWSDEFDGAVLDTNYWTYEIGTGYDGWGNGEWQYYTSRQDNCRIVDGKLVIEASKEDFQNQHFTSARIKTQSKMTVKYGRIEAKIKMPEGGHGIWPAFWMLGENISTEGWPACGEIDIVELMSDPGKVLGTLHYGSSDPFNHDSNGGQDTTVGNMSDGYHVYAVEWDERQIRWYRDDVNFYNTSGWWTNIGEYPAPFDKQFFIILNFAVGSNWWNETTTNAEVSFPQQMMVEYVRVYKKVDIEKEN